MQNKFTTINDEHTKVTSVTTNLSNRTLITAKTRRETGHDCDNFNNPNTENEWGNDNYFSFCKHCSGGRIFHGRKVDVTLVTREQCSRLQQSRWCRYWFIAAHTTAGSDSQCLNGLDNPQKLPLPLAISGLPFNTWFLKTTRVGPQTGSRSL